jgi:hypothetical protein
MGITGNLHARRAMMRRLRLFRTRTVGAAVAAVLCGMFGLAAIAVSGVPSDGGVFAFGDAGFVGSLPGLTPPVRVSNVVGAVPTLF